MAPTLPLALLLTACTLSRVERAAQDAARRVQEAPLARVAHGTGPPPEAVTLVLQQDGRFFLDDAPALLQVPPDVLLPWMEATGVRPGPATGPLDPSDGYLLPTLAAALNPRVERDREVWRGLEEPMPDRIVVAPPGDLPYARLVQVLYTVGQSGLGRFHLAVRGPDGVAQVPVDAPRVGASCAFASLLVGSQEVEVRFPPSGPPSEPDPPTRPQVLEDRVAPSRLLDLLSSGPRLPAPVVEPEPTAVDSPQVQRVPLAQGVVDEDVLVRLLAGAGSPCRVALVGAEPGTPWQTLAGVLDVLLARQAVDGVSLFVTAP